MEKSFKDNKTVSGGRVWLFLVLAFAIAWPLWIASGILGREEPIPRDFGYLLAQIGVFGPSLAALVISSASGAEMRRNSLRLIPVLLVPLAVPGMLVAAASPGGISDYSLYTSIATIIVAGAVIVFFSPINGRLLIPATGDTQAGPGARWIVLSIVLFPALFLLAWLLANLKQGTWAVASLQGGSGSFVRIVIVSFAYNLLLGGSLGEEIGWRGFLLPQLLRRYGPFVASLLLAVVWALWHLPIDIRSGFLVTGPGAVLIRIIWTIPVTIIFTWFYIRSGGNLLVALFLHTSINILSDLGFSQYERTALFLFVLLAIAAILISAASTTFRIAGKYQSKDD